jgi:hypothetical protein
LFILSQLNQASAEDPAKMTSGQLRFLRSEELMGVMAPYVSVSLFLLILAFVIKVLNVWIPIPGLTLAYFPRQRGLYGTDI